MPDEVEEDKMKCTKCGKKFDPNEKPLHKHEPRESWEILPEYKEGQDG